MHKVHMCAGLALVAVVLTLSGCYTTPPTVVGPTPPVNWTRELASRIEPLGESILKSPVVSTAKEPILLKIGGMLDKTRFTVDTDFLMKKMRTHLVNNGGGRIVVYDNDADVGEFIRKRKLKRMHEALKGELKFLAERIVKSVLFRGRNVRVAVMPSDVSSHLKGVNADGFIELLRDEIMEASSGNITFISGDKASEADYLLRGNFSAFSMTDEVARDGKGPNADMNLRIMFVEPSASESCFEVKVPVRRKLFDPSLDATLILSGELNVITRETPSMTDDYVRMGFNIINPDTGTHVWEGACEVSATNYKSVLYQ